MRDKRTPKDVCGEATVPYDQIVERGQKIDEEKKKVRPEREKLQSPLLFPLVFRAYE